MMQDSEFGGCHGGSGGRRASFGSFGSRDALRRQMFGGRHGGFGGGRSRARRGPRVGRGDVRAAILALLSEEPRNGYQIIQEIERRSDGIWRPSSGSVYPAIQLLTDEGLIESEESSGKKVSRLSEEGEAYVREHEDEVREPWSAVSESVDDLHYMLELRSAAGQLFSAMKQVGQTGSREQIEQTEKVLSNARRDIYRILADDPRAEEPAGEDEETEE